MATRSTGSRLLGVAVAVALAAVIGWVIAVAVSTTAGVVIGILVGVTLLPVLAGRGGPPGESSGPRT